MANTKYKTAKQIETEARTFGMEFVTYPSSFNFQDGKQRFITAEIREELAKKQQQMFNVEFDAFLDRIYAVELPEEIITMFENMYYNRPTYAYAIASGADINLKKVATMLESSKNDENKLRIIADQLNGQLNVAALKGIVRDYYSGLISAQKGYEGKASRSFMGNFDLLLENAVFYTGAESFDPRYKELMDGLKINLKQIRDYQSLPKAEEITKLSNKAINSYTNSHLIKDFADNSNPTAGRR